MKSHLFFYCVSDSSCTNMEMGFCIESVGMTEGGQGEPPSSLEQEGEWVEEPDFNDETVSMEDDQDAEV